MGDLPGPGLKPVSPALAGGFLTTAPPGKPSSLLLDTCFTLSFWTHSPWFPSCPQTTPVFSPDLLQTCFSLISQIYTYIKISALLTLSIYPPNIYRAASEAPSPTTSHKVACTSINTYPQNLLYFSSYYLSQPVILYIYLLISHRI